jgi:hypothetical protein
MTDIDITDYIDKAAKLAATEAVQLHANTCPVMRLIQTKGNGDISSEISPLIQIVQPWAKKHILSALGGGISASLFWYLIVELAKIAPHVTTTIDNITRVK